MATITASGVGSGIDVNSLVSQLMTVEKQPLVNLQSKQTTITNQLSALGKVKSAIATLETAAKAMSTTDSLYSYKATVGNTSIASATTTSDAVGGSYSLEVDRLATAHKLMSAAGVDPSAGGSLQIQLGSTKTGSFVANSGTSPINVTINAGSSLSDVAGAINSANAGVSATVINGASGAQLVVTSNSTGETNQIKITSTISGLGFDPDNPGAAGSLTQQTAGQDAIVKIDGVTIANTSSNTVTDAIDGVTLNLLATNQNSPTTLTVANDTSGLTTKVTAFVKAYNDARSLMKTLTQYDSTGSSTGILNGDGAVSSVIGQLRTALSTVPSGTSSAFSYLSDLGINSSADGTLSVDSTKLQSAMNQDFASVSTTLAAYGTAFDTLTTSMNSTDGLITSRTTSLTNSSNAVGDRIDALNRQLTQIEARYRAQYTALDTLLAQMQSTSSYLTQQLSSLSSSSK